MSEKYHKEHIFEWIAIYKEDNIEKILYQFDEDSEYYDKVNKQIPFVPIVMNILNREKRLLSFHLVPRGQTLSVETLPRYTVDLENFNFQINGQMLDLFKSKTQLYNPRLIWYFSPVKVYAMGDDGEPDLSKLVNCFIRLYKLGLQANDRHGKNYKKVMIWNREDEGITIHDKRE